jgi:CO/xanthine dehydrogenase Mo-binding subunit
MAGERLGVPVDDLAVSEGVISVARDPSRSVGYGDLVGGRRFDVTLVGDNVNDVGGRAAIKTVQDLRIVGRPLPRYDIPAKVDGSMVWAVDVRVPGMVHARNVRPPVAGARLVSVDEASVEGLPGAFRCGTRKTQSS